MMTLTNNSTDHNDSGKDAAILENSSTTSTATLHDGPPTSDRIVREMTLYVGAYLYTLQLERDPRGPIFKTKRNSPEGEGINSSLDLEACRIVVNADLPPRYRMRQLWYELVNAWREEFTQEHHALDMLDEGEVGQMVALGMAGISAEKYAELLAFCHDESEAAK